MVPAAAFILVVFAAVAAALHTLMPASAAQLAAADPLLRQMRAWAGPWGALGFGGVVGLVWMIARSPAREELRRAFIQAVVGGVAVAALLGGLRLLFGAHLPGWFPVEESGRPGALAGLEAALVEDGLFRFMALPVLCAIGQRFSARPGFGLAIGVVLTSLALAAAHQLGGGAFHWRHFALRALVPGAFFSALFLWRPAFAVGAHGVARLALSRLFF